MSGGKVIPVRVAVRCRPLIQKELNEGCQMCVSFIPGEPQVVLGKDKAFTYDYVFSNESDQTEVYRAAVLPLFKHIFKGYNATVMAYGQTGSGKTFTMGGCYEASLREDMCAMGIIPRVLRELFSRISEKEDTEFLVKVSYLEVYNEDINDLLCPPSQREPLAIREDNEGIKLPGIREVEVKSYEETMQCLERGSHGRTTGATAMNNTSSRSHAIFTVHIEQKKKEDMDDVCKCKFHLVDLAGSERAKKTQAVGDRFKEGVNINKGLLALGNVISALGEESSSRSHIPYRDAKLTRLLQDSLGGNSYTLMIACISPADSNMEETLNSLRYADRARKIKNKPVVNRDPQAAEIFRLKQLVGQLQMQLIQSGGTLSAGSGVSSVSSTTSTSTSLMSVDTSGDELRALVEKNKVLEEENNKLSDELRRAVDQSTNMCEKAIKLELKCDKLKTRLQNLKEDTGFNFDVLSASVDLDTNPEMREQFDKLKSFAEKMKKEESEDEKDSALPAEEDSEEDVDMDEMPGTPDSRAVSKEYALRQAKQNRELQLLNNLLEKKERLANQMAENDGQMQNMRQRYETQMKELETEIFNLQKQKENMQHALEDALTHKNANKVAEQRRLRLKELEQQITQLRKKMQEQTRLLKMKEQTDTQVSKLNTDIQSLKQNRVKLMKQMKEDADEFRKWKQKKDKEVLQLQQKDRKRQFEIAKLQRANQKQQGILKRKAEEALAANKRLKEALAKQKQVQQERNQKLEKYDNTSIGNRVRSWLSHELEVRVSIREAKYHLESLLNDRKTLSKQMKELNERIQDETNGPPMKKLAWMAENGDRSESSFQTLEIEKEIECLESEIQSRNVQISDLQQKIIDADQDIKGKSVWDSVHTMTEAKCALKWLLEQSVSARADMSKAQVELKDSQYNHHDNHEQIEKLERDMLEAQKKHEEDVTKLQKQHEDKVLYLLRQVQNASSSQGIPEDYKARIKFQESEIERLSHLNEDLQRKTHEVEEMKKQITVSMYQNKRHKLLPGIDDPGASPFLTPRVKSRAKRKKVNRRSSGGHQTLEEFLEEWGESEESFVDDDNDVSWRVEDTPAPVMTKKRSFTNFHCNCKTGCKSKRCSCVSKKNVCTDQCGCDPENCHNKEDQEPNSTTQESDKENTTVNDSVETLNSTFTRSSPSKENKSRISDELGVSQDGVGGIRKKRKLLNKNSFFKPVLGN